MSYVKGTGTNYFLMHVNQIKSLIHIKMKWNEISSCSKIKTQFTGPFHTHSVLRKKYDVCP